MQGLEAFTVKSANLYGLGLCLASSTFPPPGCVLASVKMVIDVSHTPILSEQVKRCRQDFALSQTEQQQLCIYLLVGDSIGTCGHAAANAEHRAGN